MVRKGRVPRVALETGRSLEIVRKLRHLFAKGGGDLKIRPFEIRHL